MNGATFIAVPYARRGEVVEAVRNYLKNHKDLPQEVRTEQHTRVPRNVGQRSSP